MSFWDWKRWQREIDWMALNGINMPLALTGQETIWQSVYKKMGLTQAELDKFFAGSTYFAWGWMGNLDGWGGPLPKQWYPKQLALQKKILTRQRSLGMKPVLPAFSGHVPAALKRIFPSAKISRCHSWGGFAGTYVLDPLDPLFVKIGAAFLKAQQAQFGTDHLYASDTFNEMHPPSTAPKYLARISSAVYRSMASADPKATWVMQGWMFLHGRNLWTQPRINALLGAVPNDRMIILDLFSTAKPVWSRTNAYNGKPWVWCMLHNWGGKQGMYGRMQKIAHNLPATLKNPRRGKLIGLGLTMEGLNTNPVVYDLMCEMAWRTKPVDLKKWIARYATRRYGQNVPQAQAAWQILLKQLYTCPTLRHGPQGALYCMRPSFRNNGSFVRANIWYKPAEVRRAFGLLLAAAPKLKNNPGYCYDLVDLGRQVMSDLSHELHADIVAAYKARNLAKFKTAAARWQTAISDTDKLLATNKMFLLGRWLGRAASYGSTRKNANHYQYNARDLITLWGDKNSPLHDYAQRQYAGLMDGFYKQRWAIFFGELEKCLRHKKPYKWRKVDAKVKDFEAIWVKRTNLPTNRPHGNPIEQARKIYKKYVAPRGGK